MPVGTVQFRHRPAVVLRHAHEVAAFPPVLEPFRGLGHDHVAIQDPFRRLRAHPLREPFPPIAEARGRAAGRLQGRGQGRIVVRFQGPPLHRLGRPFQDPAGPRRIDAVGAQAIVHAVAEQPRGLADRGARYRIVAPVALDPADHGAGPLSEATPMGRAGLPVILQGQLGRATADRPCVTHYACLSTCRRRRSAGWRRNHAQRMHRYACRGNSDRGRSAALTFFSQWDRRLRPRTPPCPAPRRPGG